jgi:amino acid transporter
MPRLRPDASGSLSVFDAVTIMVGLVIGVGVFRTPPLVAANVESEFALVAVWVTGGVVTLLGALCYAELAAAHPNTGGEYHFLSRAYGGPVALMFGWARGTVIQTGAIATVAFVLGDYAAQLFPVGPYSAALWAALSIIALTAVNVVGTLPGKRLQVVMTLLEVGSLVAIIVLGLFFGPDAPAAPPGSPASMSAAPGLAMIFVLLTYGGWNEAAYLAGELKNPSRNIVRVLLIGTVILTVLYVLANIALLSVLSLDGLRGSQAVAADMMNRVAGPSGGVIVSLAIVIAALSTLNATIFTGARVFHAMGRDLTLLPSVGEWNERGKTPANGLIAQAAVALALVALGTAARDGFKTMVDYTAPVFWFFLLLTALSLFVLRWREPDRVLPFRVPLYPVTPILFCISCAYMLQASLAYTGVGALIGILVLAAGTPLLLFRRERSDLIPGPDELAARTSNK